MAHSDSIAINEIGDAMKSENFQALTSELNGTYLSFFGWPCIRISSRVSTPNRNVRFSAK